MKILSFDVGIKNLAYCIINYDIDNDIIQIIEWDIINLLEKEMDNTYENRICTCIKKKKRTPCTNGAKFWACINNKKYFYCQIHKSDNILHKYAYIPTQFAQNNKCDTLTCCYINNRKIECSKLAKWYFISNDNLIHNYCTSHKSTYLKNEKKLTQPIQIKKIKCKNIDVAKINLNMINIFDNKYKHFLNTSTILIELQPVYLGPKMKSISNNLFTYFTIRGLVDKKINNSTIENVKYIFAKSKLRINDENTIEVLNKSTSDSNKYKLSKELSKQYTRQLLQNDDINLKFFDTQSKQDDLADAYLQAVFYINKKIKII